MSITVVVYFMWQQLVAGFGDNSFTV